MTFLRRVVLDSLVRKGLIGMENEGFLAFCLSQKEFASVYTILLILRSTFLARGTHGYFARHLDNCLGLAPEATSSGQHEAKSVGIRFPLSGMWRNYVTRPELVGQLPFLTVLTLDRTYQWVTEG